jgi:hypothetical protein
MTIHEHPILVEEKHPRKMVFSPSFPSGFAISTADNQGISQEKSITHLYLG